MAYPADDHFNHKCSVPAITQQSSEIEKFPNLVDESTKFEKLLQLS
jgi:hypothetical protein